MRIFSKNGRLNINEKNYRDLFRQEWKYYRNSNRYPVKLFSKNIVNIYKNINVQCVMTYQCNKSCPFCIEKGVILKTKDPVTPCLSVLEQYLAQGITPSLSITGGEPTIEYQKCTELIEGAQRLGVKNINLNTNGLYLDKVKLRDINVNLSRHEIEEDKDVSNYYIQCVLSHKISDVIFMKELMDYYLEKGVLGFSFRGISVTEKRKGPNLLLFEILQKIIRDPNFEFVQQKIGDHYFFEFYKYKKHPVRITFSDFQLLEELEYQEMLANDWCSRATIIRPNGWVYAGWNYETNLLATRG